VADGEADPRHEAYLIDRVRMNEGREQVYGTQLADFRDGALVPWPIEDPHAGDRRRASVGLEPLREYIVSFSEPKPDQSLEDSRAGQLPDRRRPGRDPPAPASDTD